MKIIISGSRDFTDRDFLFSECLEIIAKLQYKHEIALPDVEIVSGHNPRGADYYGERFAEKYGIKTKLFPANWNDITTPPVIIKPNFYGSYNALAGKNRDEQMAKYATKDDIAFLIAFCVDKSPGTKHMVSVAKSYGIEIFLYEFEKDSDGKIFRVEKKRKKREEL